MINNAKYRIGIFIKTSSCKLTLEDISKIYDVTKFICDHPGGVRALLRVGGKYAIEEFVMLHPSNILEKYKSEIQYIFEYKS